jgi:chitinase
LELFFCLFFLCRNYNYGACGKYLNIALLTDPGLISGSAVTAFRTAFWYWMTQGGHAGVTPHNAILAKSFAGTIRAINGDIECKSGTHYSEAGHQEMLSRVSYYKSFCQVLGVKDIGTDLEC